MAYMESLLSFSTFIETIVDSENSKIAQGYLLAPFHCNKFMAEIGPTLSSSLIFTECLQDPQVQHADTGVSFKSSITSIPMTNTKNPLYYSSHKSLSR